eukprot:s836_g2.t1
MEGVRSQQASIIETLSHMEDSLLQNGCRLQDAALPLGEVQLQEADSAPQAAENLDKRRDSRIERNPEIHRLLAKIKQQDSRSHSQLVPTDAEQGLWQRLHLHCKRFVETVWFECFISAVIVLNSALIGVETQMSLNGHDLVWADEAEVVFLVIYISEILLRCIAEKWGCLFDWWFLFDFTLVLSACVEQVAYIFTGSSADQIMILRLLRLIRLVRSFRMIKQIKSIWRLVYGLLTCGQTMFSTFALLSLVIYVFGVLGVEVISNNTELQSNSATAHIITNHFASLGMTMMTLLQFVTMDSIAPVYTPLALEQPLLLLYFLPLGAIVSISLMNLITAVLVEGALEHARQDREEERCCINRRILDRASVDSMEELFKILDVDSSGLISRAEFEEPLKGTQEGNGRMLRLLRDAVGELQGEVIKLQQKPAHSVIFVCLHVGVPEETTGTTVIRLDGAGKNTGNEDDLLGIADSQPVVLVMQTCSHDAPYGEHFRVQETLRFVPADRGVELQRWVEVIWVKSLPWALGALRRIIETKTVTGAEEAQPDIVRIIKEAVDNVGKS